jgi:hypothetical protein
VECTNVLLAHVADVLVVLKQTDDDEMSSGCHGDEHIVSDVESEGADDDDDSGAEESVSNTQFPPYPRAHLPTHLPTYLPTLLPAYPTHLPCYLLTLPTHQPTYLFKKCFLQFFLTSGGRSGSTMEQTVYIYSNKKRVCQPTLVSLSHLSHE